MQLQWSCTIDSLVNFDSACDVSGSTGTSSIITIGASALSPGVTYAFNLVVSSTDGRSASQTVLVTPASSGSAQSAITSSFTRFNPSTKLVLNSYLSASYAVTSTWSVSTALGEGVSIASLTPQTKSFSAADASSAVTFPLSVPAGVFAGGKTYTFRLSVSSTSDSSLQSYTEIVLIANAPPTSGYLVSAPTGGDALITQFLLSSPGWTTDAANFPLSYAFSYRLSSSSPYLTVAASSLRAHTTTALPAGLPSQGYNLTLQAQVTDIYLSEGTAAISVRVKLVQAIDVANILMSSLTTAFDIGDINLAILTVNNVSSSYLTSIAASQFYFD